MTTPNYNWPLIQPTDFVTNLPADFETFADAVDISVKGVEDGAVAKTFFDAKGDLITATADNTPAIISVGANGTYLTADSSEATGLKWTTAASPTVSWVLLGSSTGLSSGSEVSFTGLSGYNQLQLIYYNISSTSTSYLRLRFNSDTANNYTWAGQVANDTSGTASGIGGDQSAAANSLLVSYGTAANNHDGYLYMSGTNSTAPKIGHFVAGVTTASGNIKYNAGFRYSGTSVISSLQVAVDSGTFDAGEILLYGSVA